MSLNSPEFQARINEMRAQDAAEAQRRAKEASDQLIADKSARARQQMARDAEAVLYREHLARSQRTLNLAREVGQSAVAKGVRSTIKLATKKRPWSAPVVSYEGWMLSRKHNKRDDEPDFGHITGELLGRDGGMYAYSLYGYQDDAKVVGFHVLRKNVPAGMGGHWDESMSEAYWVDEITTGTERVTPITLDVLEENNNPLRRLSRADTYEQLLARFALDNRLV